MKKMRKILLALLTVLTLGVGGVALTSCGGTGSSSEKSSERSSGSSDSSEVSYSSSSSESLSTEGSSVVEESSSSEDESSSGEHKHDYTEQSIIIEATCVSVGEIMYSCKCGDSYTEELAIDADNHNFENGVCTRCGVSVGDDSYEYGYELGKKMADFTIITSDEQSFNLYEELEENKVVVLKFWATWCGYCMQDFPHLNNAYAAYQDEVSVLAISITDSASVVANFKEDSKLPFDMADDSIGLSSAFSFKGIPYSVVIDRYGVIVYTKSGAAQNGDEYFEIFEIYCAEDYPTSIILDGNT